MNDEALHALLQRWDGIEPPTNFEANVWRRIRFEDCAKPALSDARWRSFWAMPAWAAALAASIVIGASAGVLSAVHPSELQFMSSGTLAGAYARLK